MSNKQTTAVENLRKDLIFTIDSTKDALLEIENVAIRNACQEVVRLTLKKIIKRIDDELLDIEKQQIIDAYLNGRYDADKIVMTERFYADQYYTESYGEQDNEQ
jgi:hypothetical protein